MNATKTRSEPDDAHRPSVHVIVVHHRGRDILRSCVSSVLGCEGVALDVVVVVNGGEEEVPEEVLGDSRVVVVPLSPPVGFSEANNRGVAYALERFGAAEFYYFLNNDTESDETSLLRLVSSLQESPGAAVAGPMLRIAWARDYLNSLGINVTEDGWGWDEGIGQRADRYGEVWETRPVLAVTGSALLISASAFKQAGGWTEIYGYYFEDIDLCLKVRSLGLEVIHEPRALVYHHVSATMTLGSPHKVFLFWRNRIVLMILNWPAKLLFKQLVRVALEQCWGSSADAPRRLRLRALASALRRLPVLVSERLRRPGGEISWSRFLKPVGSTPPIRLPRQMEVWAAPRPGGERRSRVLVVGASPLLMEAASRNFAAGSKTWQLTKPILDAGYEVLLVGCRLPHSYPDGMQDECIIEDRPRFRYLSVQPAVFRTPGFLTELATWFDPCAVVFAHASVSFEPCLARLGLPTWIDVNGHIMTEAQAKASAYGNDSFLDHFFSTNLELLRAGDRFSSCCDAQTWAMVGELGLIGRLNSRNCGEELVHTIPLGVPDEPYTSRGCAFRGCEVPPEAFVVLWSGGFNTWADVDTLFDGLEWAMSREALIFFVSTGGQIDGHDEITYPAFVSRVQQSPNRDRFVLRGWVPWNEVADHYLEADVGVNCEKYIYEGILGSKHRILDWSRAALPAVTSRLTEISRTVEAESLGWVFDPGDSRRLGEILVDLSRNRECVQRTGARCKERMRELFGYDQTVRPLLEWLRDPQPASDRFRSTHCVEGILWRQSVLTERVREYEARLGITAEQSIIGADGLARLDHQR